MVSTGNDRPILNAFDGTSTQPWASRRVGGDGAMGLGCIPPGSSKWSEPRSQFAVASLATAQVQTALAWPIATCVWETCCFTKATLRFSTSTTADSVGTC